MRKYDKAKNVNILLNHLINMLLYVRNLFGGVVVEKLFMFLICCFF